MQVEGDLPVQLIVLHVIVEFWDFDELVHVEPIFNASP